MLLLKRIRAALAIFPIITIILGLFITATALGTAFITAFLPMRSSLTEVALTSDGGYVSRYSFEEHPAETHGSRVAAGKQAAFEVGRKYGWQILLTSAGTSALISIIASFCGLAPGRRKTLPPPLPPASSS